MNDKVDESITTFFSCERKKKYTRVKDALNGIAKWIARDRSVTKAGLYRCINCGNWHITKKYD